MHKFRWLLITWLAAASTVASAATITIDWDSSVFNPGSIDVGTVTFPGGSTGTNAGRFEGRATAWSGISPSSFYASQNDFFAYCFDLAQTLSDGVYTVVPGAPTAVLDWLGAVNAHFGGGAYRWLSPANSTEAAVIQLGIWEALFSDDFVLTGGLVKFSSVPGGVASLFNTIAGERGAAANLDAQYVMVLTSPDRQDVITGLRVPEPASLLLVAAAALAGAMVRRRR